ncbi:leukocyte elastase inhibitor A-like [Ciona intestinalis]
MTRTELALSLPHMKFEKQLDLVGSLKNLGLVDLFDGNKSNLRGISDDGDLFVSQVAHKAFIEVNETGTEAAAATAMIAMLSMVLPSTPPVQFNCDHPFLFLIKHNPTNSVLCLGRCSDPS